MEVLHIGLHVAGNRAIGKAPRAKKVNQATVLLDAEDARNGIEAGLANRVHLSPGKPREQAV